MHYLAEHLASPAVFELSLVLISVLAGVFGAVLGLGGGIIIVPALTLIFGINIRYAVGASIISVIATSSGAAATYVRDRITNIRVAMILEVATTLGALSGAVLASHVAPRRLFLLFSLLLIFSAVMMFRRRHATVHTPGKSANGFASYLRLHGSYYDPHLKQDVAYLVDRVPLGFFLMLGAGLLSALLGIGSGVLKVPAMDTAMGLPLKASSATSNFMIGVTGAASAGAYYMKNDIIPLLAAPIALGVLLGSWVGTHLMMRIPTASIRKVFIAVLLFVSFEMFLRGLGK